MWSRALVSFEISSKYSRLSYSNHVPKELLAPGTALLRIFEIARPQIPLDFDNICNFINAVFVLQVKTSPTNARRHDKTT